MEDSSEFFILKVVAARLGDTNSGKSELESSLTDATDLETGEERASGAGEEDLVAENVAAKASFGPGAVAVRPNAGVSLPVAAEGLPEGQENALESPQDHNLSVATPVDELSGHLDLQEAEAVDPGAPKASVQRTKEFQRIFCLGAVLFVGAIAVAIVLATSTSGKGDEPKATTSEWNATIVNSQMSPSPVPATVEELVHALIPEETMELILQEPKSPQARAHQWLMEDPFLSSYSSARVRQRFALATLFYSTSGETWTTKNNWLIHETHECEWYNKPDFASKELIEPFYPGYLAEFFPLAETIPPRCNSLGLYQHLWLDQNGLVGSLPDELYWLTNLKTLSVGRNQLEGAIATQVGQLSSLEGLVLTGLRRGGRIPSEIGKLTKLRGLLLFDCGHQGPIPKEIWQLAKLQTLSLEANLELTGTIPSEIANISNLRWLFLGDNLITGSIPSTIGTLTNLEQLSIGNNQLTGTLPDQLGMMTKLTLLSAAQNQMKGHLPTELSELTSLALLGLWMNQLSGPVPSEFGLLTSLSTVLSLDDNYLTGNLPSELGLLSNLGSLELANNMFDGHIPSEFGRLSSAGLVLLGNNNLSGAIPEELAALKPTLHTLHILGNPLLSGTMPSDLCILDRTCVDTAINPCWAEPGFVYDCSAGLCGCNCTC